MIVYHETVVDRLFKTTQTDNLYRETYPVRAESSGVDSRMDRWEVLPTQKQEGRRGVSLKPSRSKVSIP